MTAVHFELLNTLVATGRRRDLWRSEMLLAGFFASIHIALVASAGLGAEAVASLETPLVESVTYLDVPAPSEPTSPRTALKPRPVVVSQAVRIPAVQETVTRPDKAAGFQELLAPREIKPLPPPDARGAVDERDFSGRGVVGGVAGGKPPPRVPPGVAAALAAEGRITDAPTRTVPREIKPMEMAAVQIKPALINRNEVTELLEKFWPPVLLQAGIEGSAIVQFVVDTVGKVVPGSAKVLSSSHPQFAGSALQVLEHLRFTPGRMSFGGTLMAVPVHVRVPFKWTQPQ